jgi:hypothetical protein
MTAVIGLLIAAILAVIYARLENWIPFVYLNVILLLGLGFVIGLVVQNRARAAKIRHAGVAGMIALLCGLVALYFAWAADFVFRTGAVPPGHYLNALDPLVLGRYVSFFYENGAWGLGKGGGVVKGWFLGLVWVIEALVIVGFPTLIVANEFGDNVFCERCRTWNTTQNDVVRLSPASGLDVSQLADAENLDELCRMPHAEAGAAEFLRVNLSTCASCPETNTLRIDRVTVKTDKKDGKPSETTQTLISRLLISPEELEAVRQLASPPESAPDAASSPEAEPQTS